MQDHEFGLGFLTLEVVVTHISQILECLINVTHTDPARNWRRGGKRREEEGRGRERKGEEGRREGERREEERVRKEGERERRRRRRRGKKDEGRRRRVKREGK